MFYSRMTEHTLQKPVQVKDKLNHIQLQYEDCGTAFLYIVKTDETTYRANELITGEQFFTAYTQEPRIQREWVIDRKYKVSSVKPHRTGYALTLTLLDGAEYRTTA